MKGALVIGIDNYPGSAKLNGCVNDATGLAALLKRNDDGTRNFDVVLKTNVQTRPELRAAVTKLFKTEVDTALLYFAGHGCSNERGGYLITPDFKNYDEGISMDEILNLVNQSQIKHKIIIIDCCHSGAFGAPVLAGARIAYLAEGVIIIAAARASESSMEVNGHGIFTRLLMSALEGGAADIGGHITCAGIYAYIERSLGFWEQRPQFKANVQRFAPIRTVKPFLSVELVLKKIVEYFKTPDAHFALDPTYEYTNTDIAIQAHVDIMKDLQQLFKISIVEPVGEEFMYWAAQNSKACKLTPLGQYYWKLISEEKI